ncbi:MAG TPA: aromatic ring-hydroxylating dioxygenase subunit alpha [Thermoleophilaceae bacterium]|nr:aromatic ring-hydroxylating dioxygenase subunit alpha [Thermoleophilaceae bacterium]
MTSIADLTNVDIDRVEEAIADGAALPPEWYQDEAIFEFERERIFKRSWQYAGRADLVAQPGDFFRLTVAGVPLVIVRDEEGELRGFVNVCRHRACEVVQDDSGSARFLRCPYHAWTYGLDGQLKAAPKQRHQENFDPGAISLAPIGVGQLGPLLFVNPDSTGPELSDYLGILPALWERAGLDASGLEFRRRVSYDVAANWKVLVENFVECYHCAVVHEELSAALDLKRFRVECEGNVIHEVAPTDRRYAGYDDSADVVDGTYDYLFPSFISNIFPGRGNAFARNLIPIDPQRTRVTYDLYCVPDASPAEEEEAFRFADRVFREDMPLVESVQRGLNSGRSDRCHLFLTDELGPQYFQQLVWSALADDR